MSGPEQRQGRRVAKRYSVGDDFLTVGEIMARTGLCRNTVESRIRRGQLGGALVAPAQRPPTVEVDGEHLTTRQIAERAGLSLDRARARIYVWPADRLLEPAKPRSASDAPAALGISRAGPGKPPPGHFTGGRAASLLAAKVAMEWADSDAERHRLSEALSANARSLLALFDKGYRVRAFGRLLAQRGVTNDSGGHLTEATFYSAWVVLERNLARRVRSAPDGMVGAPSDPKARN